MKPRVIVISGSLKGTTFALPDHETLLGRDRATAICLNDNSISRRHCLIRQNPSESNDDPRFTIVDLDSFNGTFVNGVPVKQKELAHGDQIALGDVILLFLLEDTEIGPRPSFGSSERDLITRSTIRLRKEDALYLRPETVAAELPASAQVARDLNALLKISRAISTVQNQHDLQDELIRFIAETVPAERVVIYLSGEMGEGTQSSRGWTRSHGMDESVTGSRTIISQVLHERMALLSNDLIYDQSLAEAPSLKDVRICSVLCVPLTIFDRALGVVYLDTGDQSARFDESHLRLKQCAKRRLPSFICNQTQNSKPAQN